MTKERILTGICFPDYEIQNKNPHLTLMTNKWTPKYSNTMLEAALK